MRTNALTRHTPIPGTREQRRWYSRGMSRFHTLTLVLVAAFFIGCGSGSGNSATPRSDAGADATSQDAADASWADGGVPDANDAGAQDATSQDAASHDASTDAAPEACVPNCTGKTCGDDGCGGSCGTCGSGQGCGDQGTCVDACPCFYNQCTNCYCATAAEQYAVGHNCVIPAYKGNEGALLSCSGSSTAPATWSVGQQCSNGCVVAPPKTPDYCAPAPGTGHKLWIAFDGATAANKAHTQDFFTCVFQHSNFDQLATGYSSGRSFGGVGGIAQLATPCATVHGHACASVGDDSATLQCIENQTKWVVAPDDIILYYPATATKNSACGSYTGGCVDGRNHWHIPIKLPNGTSVSVEAAFGFTGSGAKCQTALGLHEVYEAAADSQAADCCNGQKTCYNKEPNPPFGWYSKTGCSTSWELQYISPAGQEWNAGACEPLTFN